MGKPLLLNWAGFVAAFAFVGAAHAQDAVPQPPGAVRAEETVQQPPAEPFEVQLKNGNAMRGTLLSIEPGQRVIVIVAGEQSVIPWNEIAKIVGRPKDVTVAPPAPPDAVPPPSSAKGMPFLHIQSEWPNLELSRVDGELGGGFQTEGHASPQSLSKFVCRAPCDKAVDGREGHRFFISGPGMYPTPQFRLDSYSGDVTARVRGVGTGRFVSGVLLAGAGGMFAVSGLMFVGMSYIPEEPSAENPNPERSSRQIRTIGGTIAGVGVAMGITAIALLAAGRTEIELIKSNNGEAKLVLDHGILRF